MKSICIIHFSDHLGSTLGKLAKRSRDEADLYVFITGSDKGRNGNPLGIAYVASVCNQQRTLRVSINRYGIPGSGGPRKNKIMYTAEVNVFQIHYECFH